jgi:zinc transport system substrate-binding protein
VSKLFKKLTTILIITIIVITLSAFANKGTGKSDKAVAQTKIPVTVSFNAMKEFTQAIGKDKVEITTIIPDGTEPHDFELKPRDLLDLNSAKVFVCNGFGMESAWESSAVNAVANKNLLVVDASKGLKPLSNINKSEGQNDPHIWISLKGAETEAKNIKNALIQASPKNKDYFEKNYTEFYNQLEKLYADYNSKFKGIKNKNFVTGHAAFGYLCRDFGLKQTSVEGVFAEGEPSAKKLKELIDYCKTNKIKTVFAEDMVSPKVSETLAKEVGAKVETIYTIESQEDNKSYIQRMSDNLIKIYNSLK